MGLARGVLLAASQSKWLREQATRRRFVRRAVSRFMPGETLDEAIAAAVDLGKKRLGTLFTHLGENIRDESEADAVADHYLDALERVAAAGIDTEMSVKLTQLGLDVGRDLAAANLRRLAERTRGTGTRLWVDMEDSTYTTATLDLFKEVHREHAHVCVALQAYLYRTKDDLEDLIERGAGVRIVKGAYREPASVAFPKKKDVDASFLALGKRMMSREARERGVWPVIGTHDGALIRALAAFAPTQGAGKEDYEFAFLYGIAREEQQRLAREDHKVRVLISYGAYWFPWYMRRLAERPANVWFVLKNAFGG